MGYYTRAFCKSAKAIPLSTVLDALAKRGLSLDVPNASSSDLDSTEWTEAILYYKEGKLPILAECNRRTGSQDCLAEREIGEFLERLGKPGLFSPKRTVAKYLEATKFIVCCQLPISDIDADGERAIESFLDYYAANCDGLFQADDRGFFEGERVLWDGS